MPVVRFTARRVVALSLLAACGRALGLAVGSDPALAACLATPAQCAFFDASFAGLSGSLPSELGDLSALSRVDFSSNAINGTLPTELGRLTALEWFSARSNALTGSLPAELAAATALSYLYADGNALTGTLPATALPAGLRALHLDANALSGPLPTELGSLTQLYSLRLGGGNAWTSVPTELALAPLGNGCSIAEPGDGSHVPLPAAVAIKCRSYV